MFSLSVPFWHVLPLQLCLSSLRFHVHFSLFAMFFSVNGKYNFVLTRAMLMSCMESLSSLLHLSAVLHMSPCAGSLSALMQKHQIRLVSTDNNKSTNWFMDKQINLTVLYFSWMSLEVCVVECQSRLVQTLKWLSRALLLLKCFYRYVREQTEKHK